MNILIKYKILEILFFITQILDIGLSKICLMLSNMVIELNPIYNLLDWNNIVAFKIMMTFVIIFIMQHDTYQYKYRSLLWVPFIVGFIIVLNSLFCIYRIQMGW